MGGLDKVSLCTLAMSCNHKSPLKIGTVVFQNEAIVNRATGRCLEVVPANVVFSYMLVLRTCTGQRWTIKNTMKQ